MRPQCAERTSGRNGVQWRMCGCVVRCVLFLVLFALFCRPLWPMVLSPDVWEREESEVGPNASVLQRQLTYESPVFDGCGAGRRSFKPLGNFTFWGKVMNATWPCPTSGMNNQLILIMGRLHCLALSESRRSAGIVAAGGAPPTSVFKWKDISCSPTGGVDGRKFYAVGGGDYMYMWFRWSELLEFTDVRMRLERDVGARRDSDVLLFPEDNSVSGGTLHPATEHVTRVCLSDSYSWSEQPWLSNCPSSVDHIWGTAHYWDMRRSLRTHPWFDRAAVDFLQKHGVGLAPSQQRLRVVMALHVRRGDYAKFCRENERGRGRYKYRVPPFVYLRRRKHPNNTILSADFQSACYPSLQRVVTTVAQVAATHRHINVVLLMTNSPSFQGVLIEELQRRVDTQHLVVLSFVAAGSRGERSTGGEVPPPYWPRRAAQYTAGEVAWMDMTLISMAEVMVLNRYSTFSHSALDLHILRESRLASKLMWW